MGLKKNILEKNGNGRRDPLPLPFIENSITSFHFFLEDFPQDGEESPSEWVPSDGCRHETISRVKDLQPRNKEKGKRKMEECWCEGETLLNVFFQKSEIALF